MNGGPSGRSEQQDRFHVINPYLDDNVDQAMSWTGDTIVVQPPHQGMYASHALPSGQSGSLPYPIPFPASLPMPMAAEAGPSSQANGNASTSSKKPGRPRMDARPSSKASHSQTGGRTKHSKNKSVNKGARQVPCTMCGEVDLVKGNGKMDVMLSCSNCSNTGELCSCLRWRKTTDQPPE
jgi:hypothetical protein